MQKTAYEMRISDWSSDVCSSDLGGRRNDAGSQGFRGPLQGADGAARRDRHRHPGRWPGARPCVRRGREGGISADDRADTRSALPGSDTDQRRSEEHTSELQSLMRTSYSDFCLKKKTIILTTTFHSN